MRHLRFGHFAGKHPAHTLATGMYMQHHLHGKLLTHPEKNPQYLDHKIHRRVVVIEQHDLEQGRWRQLRPRGCNRNALLTVVRMFVLLAHDLIIASLTSDKTLLSTCSDDGTIGVFQPLTDDFHASLPNTRFHAPPVGDERRGLPMKLMVGVSGGVDSAVAAMLLQAAGHDVEGLFMTNWEESDPDSPCAADQDRKDAAAICAQLGIRFHARNFAAEYMEQVFAHFLAEYRAGRTPNPDVLCNREIKFRTFLDEARQLGADRIATGHYAQIGQENGRHTLLRATDADKDQSYFLHTLGQEQLAATAFPIGELRKPAVRALARGAGLVTHAKKDSTGICFIGERNFRDFLGRYIPAQPGEMRTPDGTIVGRHDGVMYYTLGQRQGLGLGGRAGAGGEPWYVVGKDIQSSVLYVAQGGENHWLQSQRLDADELSWVAGSAPACSFRCTAKTRYRQPDQTCEVAVDDDRCSVRFDVPQRAVTPGQSVVFYDGALCLGGGVINATDAPLEAIHSRSGRT